jgi:tetratricopeptide (TPR) repeat protein
LSDQWKYAEAEKEYRAVLAMRERVLGAEHPDVAVSCFNIATCLLSQGKLHEALEFVNRAEKLWLASLGAEHPDSKDAKELREEIEAKVKKQ